MLTDDEIQRVMDYHATFSTPHGLRVLDDLRHYACYFRTTAVPGDPFATHLNEGARLVLVRIENLLRHNTEQVRASRQLEED